MCKEIMPEYKTEMELFSSSQWPWVLMLSKMSFWFSLMNDQFSLEKQITICIEFQLTSGQRFSLNSHQVSWLQLFSDLSFTIWSALIKSSGTNSLYSFASYFWSTTPHRVTLWSWVPCFLTNNWLLLWHQSLSYPSCFLQDSSSIRITFLSF